MKFRATFITDAQPYASIGSDFPLGPTHGIIESWEPVKPDPLAEIALTLVDICKELREMRYATT